MSVFLATLGQRPEAITMALDALLPRYHYAEVRILHTDAERSGIADAYAQLMHVLKADYDGLKILGTALTYVNGSPLIDISDQHSAEAYYYALLEIVRQYRVQHIPIHLLVAGGRKAMSIYAALAAALLFGEHDRLWTIHTPQDMMQAGLFHAPAGTQDRVQIIQLPVRPSRLLPGVLAGEDVQHLLERSRSSPREMFLQSLTEEESKVAEALRQHPYSGNDELGEILAKSPRTIEKIYGKLFTHFDLNIEDKRKRQALLDVLAGRV
jgi:CRISPR-associated protein (TIGR02584 family)